MSYKSRLLSYSKSVTSTGSFDGTVSFSTALKINVSRPHTLQVVRASITSHLPNVYNYGGVNNGLIRVSRDDGVNWTSIQLVDGVYSINSINNAIDNVISTWNTDPADPAFALRANTTINKCYIVIDSTKLVAPGTQFCIDFNLTGSLAGDLLGFTDPTLFDTDGTYEGDVYPKLDYQGNDVKIYLEGFGALAIEDGESTKLACTIPLSTAQVTNNYIYGQNGEQVFEVPCKTRETLDVFGVTVRGTRDNTIIGYDGDFNFQFLIREY